MSTSVEHGLISPKPKDKLPVSYVYLQAPQLDGQSAGVLWAGREGEHRGRAKVIIKWRRIARARGEERWKVGSQNHNNKSCEGDSVRQGKAERSRDPWVNVDGLHHLGGQV